MLIDRVHLGDRTYPCLSFLRKLHVITNFSGGHTIRILRGALCCNVSRAVY